MSRTTTIPTVSIIISWWPAAALRSIEPRTFRDDDVDLVPQISPFGRPRHLGAQRARAHILLLVAMT